MVGLDCSGFVQIILRKLGIVEDNKDRTAQGIYDLMSRRLAFNSSAKGDCLLFFGKSQLEITHVAISIDDEWMIEAARGDSHTLLPQHAIDKIAKVEFNRIDRRKDLVACLYLNTKTI